MLYKCKILNIDALNKKTHFYSFDSISDLLENANKDVLEIDNELFWFSDFYGVKSFSEFKELIEKPNLDFINNLKKSAKVEEKIFDSRDVLRKSAQVDFVGSKPVIANALQNKPKTMMHYKKTPQIKPVLNIFLSPSFPCDYSTNQIQDFANRVFRKLYQLELLNYKTKITILTIFNYLHNKDYSVVSFNLKNENELFSLPKLSAVLGNGSFSRVMFVKWFYKCLFLKHFPKQFVPGSGSAFLSNDCIGKIMNELITKNEKAIYIDFRTDLENAFNLK